MGDEFVAITGRNGGGKSTLTKLIAGIIQSGSIKVSSHFRASFNLSYVTLTSIFRPLDFLMIEVIYNGRMSLWNSIVWHLIIYKWTVVFFGHLLCLYFQSLKITAIMLIVDFIIEWDQVRCSLAI